MPSVEVELRALEAADRVTGLKLGDAAFTPLKQFFQKSAKAFHANDLGRTYVVESLGEGRLIAYVTLVSGEIATDQNLIGASVGYAYSSYPAVKIARLAVVTRYWGNGLGRTLVEFSLGLVKSTICPAIGCRFVVVDAKEQSVKFYQRCGFTLLDTPDNKKRSEPVMFVDLHKIEVG